MNDAHSTSIPLKSQAISPYELIIFDLDGTLAPYLSETLFPDVAAWLVAHGHEQALAICTNQGGVGLRYWQETNHFGKAEEIAKLPTPEIIRARLTKIARQFPLSATISRRLQVFICYAYHSKNDKWSPTPEGKGTNDGWDRNWRKPAPGMLIAAMAKAGVTPEQTLMVGDTPDDETAAENAGCAFVWAWDFFGRPVPEADKDVT